MDKTNAIKLVEKTFGGEFNEDRYLEFVIEMFGDSSFLKGAPKEYLWKEYGEYADFLRYYGTYKDNSNKTIDILSVKLKKNRYRDRSRTMQRNLIAKWLENVNKDGAIVAFYGDDPEDWRFSFVKMEYKITEDFKIEKGFTPAKRSSFLVGKNEPNHTCKERFLEMIITEKNPSLEEIENAFSVENVSDEFFKEYKNLFLDLKDKLDILLKDDENVKKEFEEKEISTVDFAKKLLGQIVFIYFLQKKGWLGVQRDSKTGKFKEWGTGPKNFLKKLHTGGYANYENFFKEILEPLFYEALSTQRDDDYYSLFDCNIPFLNGGLFEPIGGYNWKEINLKLDNEIFEKIFKVFDRYNFTIKEDEPLDKEVAIDPEMLGKVFENLLEVIDRKSKGAFYTPREIVHYMCQQSLIDYLETNTNIKREDIEKFINLSGFSTSEYQRKLIELEKINEQLSKANISSKGYVKLLNEQMETVKNINFPISIIQNLEKVDELLRCVKIADPAVGSGAFPVGIMNEIVKARSVLTPFMMVKNKDMDIEDRTFYKLKWETIQNCLYGVDIDSSAVDITKLRFWLSLVVDEESMDDIKALPNLDHKIMCGNSLLDEFEGIKLFDDSLLETVEEEEGEPEKLKKLKIEKENLKKVADELVLNQNWKELKPISEKLKELNEDIKKLENKYKKSKNQNGGAPQSQITLSDAINIKRKKSQQKLTKLKKLYKEYFNASGKHDKKYYREKIEKLEWELIEETLIESGNKNALEKLEQYKKSRSKPFFLWKLYFSDVFRRENSGFDIVIGNPPYVRQEKIKELKPALERNYKTYTGVADLFVYFYELGYNILRDEGVLAYITSNKWMRANYGEKLRKFFKENTSIKEIIDFGGEKVFETATVDTNIMIFKKGYEKDNLISCVDFTKIKKYNGFIDGIKSNRFKIPQSDLKENSFNLSPPEELNLKKKIEKIGIPLKDWDIKINYGIKTGFNDAFIIDGKTKDELIKKDPKNKEIIKPLLRGRDIKRYGYEFADLWLIFTRRGINIDEYPVIKKHLEKYKERLEPKPKDFKGKWKGRKAGSYKWYEIQDNIAYYKEFEKEKIVWQRVTKEPMFCIADKGMFILDSMAFIVTELHIEKYLSTILNSKIMKYYIDTMTHQYGNTGYLLSNQYVERLPIPKIPENEQIPFIEKADKMIELNKKFLNKKNEFLKSLNLTKITKKLETFYNLSYKELLKELKKQKINSTDDLENRFNNYKKELNEIKQEIEKTDKEIDKMVYKLYNLTGEEIKIIENMN